VCVCVCVCVCKGGWVDNNNYAKNIRYHCTKLSHLSNQVPDIVHKTFRSVQIPRLSHFFAHCQVLEQRLKMFPLRVKVMTA